MSRRLLTVRLVAPFVVALLAAGWLLWTRSDPHRQGGYCTNATMVIAGVLRQADTGGDVGRGPLPDVGAILATITAIDVGRLQVRTPAAVRGDVDLLARRIPRLRAGGQPPDGPTTAAFARVAGDYLERCRKGR